MTRPARKAGPEVHPLPHADHAVYYGCTSRNCTCEYRNRLDATTPPPVRVIRRQWLLSAMLEDIYRGAWRLSDPELDAAIGQVAAFANGQPAASLALGATLEAP